MTLPPLFALVDRLQREGFHFALLEGRLKVAPISKLTPEDRAYLAAHREALTLWLSSPDPALEALCAGLPPDEAQELREERAAILEFDAGFSKVEAERMAGLLEPEAQGAA